MRREFSSGELLFSVPNQHNFGDDLISVILVYSNRMHIIFVCLQIVPYVIRCYRKQFLVTHREGERESSIGWKYYHQYGSTFSLFV